MAAAIAALGNPQCSGLFTIDPSAPAPATLLSQIQSGNDPHVYFTEAFLPQDNPNYATNAITQSTAFSLQNGQVTNTGVRNNAVVAFNFSPSAPFNTGSVSYDAVTVLHELGHVNELLYGMGSTYLVNDSEGVQGSAHAVASAFNTKLVQTNCFPGKH